MNKKVEIIITDKGLNGEPLTCGTTHEGTDFIEGNPYTSVGFNTNKYGMSSPCTTEEEVKSVDWIKREGDVPFVRDLRKRNLLTNWC